MAGARGTEAGQTVEDRARWLYRRFNTVYLSTGRDWDDRTDEDREYWVDMARAELESEGRLVDIATV